MTVILSKDGKWYQRREHIHYSTHTVEPRTILLSTVVIKDGAYTSMSMYVNAGRSRILTRNLRRGGLQRDQLDKRPYCIAKDALTNG